MGCRQQHLSSVRTVTACVEGLDTALTGHVIRQTSVSFKGFLDYTPNTLSTGKIIPVTTQPY